MPEGCGGVFGGRDAAPDTALEGLTELRPVFRENGTITVGNAPGLNSGASAVIVANRAFAEASGMEPLARIVAHVVSAVRPEHVALAPIKGIRLVLERALWSSADVDQFEIDEACAAVPLLVLMLLASRRTSSMWRVVPLRMVIRSVRRGRS